MAGSLTTHVLDLAHGCPAADIGIELWRLDLAGDGRTLLLSTRTNADGRLDGPLLAGAEFSAGQYELLFDVGGYFAAHEAGSEPEMPALPFLGQVPVRFYVADPAAHYHIPLLVTPWAYSTYRGS
jgi:5-hydroxyisourate hydrolase